MRGRGRPGDLPRDVGAGAKARVQQPARRERVEHAAVFVELARLDAHRAVPVHAKPRQIRLDRRGMIRTAAAGIDILDPQQEAPVRFARPAPSEQGGMGMAEMQAAGRARCEARDDGHGCHRR